MSARNEVSLTQAAIELRCSSWTARDLVLRGQLRGRQEGRFWYVDQGDLRRLVRERALDADTVDA